MKLSLSSSSVTRFATLLLVLIFAISTSSGAESPRNSLKQLVESAREVHHENHHLSHDSNSDRPTYDHQNTTYHARFHPFQQMHTMVSMNPFFSPDHSIEQIMKVIQSAKHSIDISIPSFASWIRCTYPQGSDTCIGCSAAHLIEKESFPVFQALHNALHQGIKVRIMTNDFNEPLCKDSMDLLAYLQVAGATVRYFNQLTFTHSKYICVDKEVAIISSINFSRTSIMSNREAGIIVRDAPDVVAYTQSVFEWDLNHAFVKKLPPYSKQDVQLIHSTKHIPVVIPEPYHFKYCNGTSPKPVAIEEKANLQVIISPDFAFDSIKEFQKAKHSFHLSVYQITEDALVDALIDMKKSNPKLDMKIFVSHEIYGKEDQALALKCYNRLFEHGIVVQMSHKYCLFFSHMKFWIVDGEKVWLSTGNWSPSDYPEPPYEFPVYGEKNWRKTNRDYTIHIENAPKTIQRFKDLFNLDYSQGSKYNPSS